MIRKIITYPNPLLLKKSKPVEVVDDAVRTLLDDMVETMYAHDGVGLAAPQISENIRAIVVDVSAASESPEIGLLKIVNPKIISSEDEIEFEEGCLSVPDLRVKMKRSEKIVVRFVDENGTKKELKAFGLLAIAIQHEMDHLDGRLIIDNVTRIKRDLYLRKRKKAEEHPAL
ncbi:MAG: peptide deformylase [Pseudomonadota bacterium]